MVGARRPEDVGTIRAIWEEHLEVARALSPLAPDLAAAVDVIGDTLAAGGLLLIAGNGGSAADAQHIAAELTGRFLRERAPLRAMALHTNASALTAISNDYGFERAFARELEAYAQSGDVLLAISTSGNSPNILRTVAVARSRGLRVVGLSGASGGELRALCDVCVCVPSTTVPRIQEMHTLLGHTLCQLLEARLG